jgi:hypothetical protein
LKLEVVTVSRARIDWSKGKAIFLISHLRISNMGVGILSGDAVLTLIVLSLGFRAGYLRGLSLLDEACWNKNWLFCCWIRGMKVVLILLRVR